MGFSSPLALLLFLPLAGLAALFWLAFRWKDRMLDVFALGAAGRTLATAQRPRQVAKALLVLTALAALVLAAARPYVGERPVPPRSSPADLVLLLDVSLSMAAQDVAPSRFEAARTQIMGLLDRLQGDRVGLVVFGGSATLRFPLTSDYDAARTVLRSVSIDSAPTPGTALADGLRMAANGLRQSEAPVRAIFLLSDGEDQGSEIEQALTDIQGQHYVVHAAGLGTAQGASIPVPDASGRPGALKRDTSGAPVVTRANPDLLNHIAEATGGAYQGATAEGRELVRLYERAAQQRPEPAEAPAPPNELTPYLAALALLLLLLELLLPERLAPASLPAAASAMLPLVLLAVTACSQRDDQGFQFNQQGTELYQQERYADALEMFRRAQVERADLPALNFNAGAALYKNRELERALRETQRALSDETATLREKAHFNMGNALFLMERFQDAVDKYKDALREDPNDLDAKVNLELALLQLRQQQQQQQQGQGGDGEPQNPQQQGQNSAGGQAGQQPGQQTPGGDPGQELQRSIRDAGRELTIEEVLRILDALREREQQIQGQYGRPQPTSPRSRPERDW